MNSYIKPEILIIKANPYSMVMASTTPSFDNCTCNGHCSCDVNDNPHASHDKCHCSNRPDDFDTPLFDL